MLGEGHAEEDAAPRDLFRWDPRRRSARELAPAGHTEPTRGCQAVSGAGDPCPHDGRPAHVRRRRGAARRRPGRGHPRRRRRRRRSSCTRARSRSPSAPGRVTRRPPTSSPSWSPGSRSAEADMLIRSLTRWFQLLNLAEDNERVRRLRARGDENPGSVRHAVRRIHTRGVTADELTETLAAAELRLVLTAHPTEARRRTTIEKLARIFGTLRELDDGATPERTGVRAAGGDRAGAVGLRRRAHRGARRRRRGPGRARLPLHHARAHRARRLPRDRGRDRRALPRRGGRGSRRCSRSAPGWAATATATRT